jgi:hypothetical protein
MKRLLKWTAAAVAIASGALCVSAPAQAADIFDRWGNLRISIGVPGAVGYDYNSGGYCDNYGCPDGYWDQPVWYGPVYYGGAWYQGPVYYRDIGGEHWYWIHGGWRRDEWRGPRPGWWRADYHFGPSLGFSWYQGHGFHVPQHHMDFWRAHGGPDHMGGGMMGGHDHDHDHGMMGGHDDHSHDHDHDHGMMGGHDDHSHDHDHDHDHDKDHSHDHDHDGDHH